MARVADWWFRGIGEPMVTRAFALMLEDSRLRAATVSQIGAVTGRDLSDVRWFVAERIQDDGARADLVGLDASSRPRVVIEAKFNAYLTTKQVRSYLDDQERLVGDPLIDRALVLLMPPSRVAEAENVLRQVRSERISEGLLPHTAGTGVLSWDAWIDHWELAVDDLPKTPDSIAADLVQLRAVCRALGGVVVPPFNSDTGAEWRQRESELANVVAEATKLLMPPGSTAADFPLQKRDARFSPFRWVPSGYPAPNSWMAVGLSGEFADEGSAPIWVRYDATHPEWPTLRTRIMTSALGASARHDHGNLWVPLVINPELPGPALIDDLVRQAESLRRLARE